MRATIEIGRAKGSVKAPPSKSMAHRLILCASLAEGAAEISNVALSEDIKATIGAMEAFGKKAVYDQGTLFLKDGEAEAEKNIFVNESGSTLRFLVPLCLTGERIRLYGKKRLFERPLTIYETIFDEQGIHYEKGEDYLVVEGTLQSGRYEIPGDISSQFISGLLFALARLEGDSELCITGKFESRSYVDMTVQAMTEFGVTVTFAGNSIKIPGNQRYRAKNAEVEGDWSNAAFFEALNYLDSHVTVTGLKEDSLQGDKIYQTYFEAIKKGNAVLSLANCPDLAPILFTVAAYLGGARFTDTARLKIKESDRASVMARELSKFGARLTVSDNEVTVHNEELHAPHEVLQSHNDHRVVMSLSVLATVFGGVIEDAGAVKKSMPDFFEKLTALGIKVKIDET